MRLATVTSASGRSLRIIHLGAWDLLYTLPLFVLNVIFQLALRATVAPTLIVIDFWERRIVALNLNSFRLIVATPLLLALAVLASLLGGPWSTPDLAGALLIFGVFPLCVERVSRMQTSPLANNPALYSEREATTLRRITLNHPLI